MELRAGYVGLQFFKDRQRTAYSDHVRAFWREILQNSRDAGATCVNIGWEVVPGESPVEGDIPAESVIRVTIEDNGSGMDRKTLEDVFFCLGASTKRERNDAIGGFGTARMLLCFSRERYVIETHDLRVVGRGILHAIQEGQPFYDGCRFIIDIDSSETSLAQLDTAIRKQMNMSWADGMKVTVNGELIPWGTPAGVDVTRVFADVDGKPVPFATLQRCVGDTAHLNYSQIVVRQSGIAMISRCLSGPGSLILEVDQAFGREAFYESRDEMRGPYHAAFSALVEKLNVERLSALRSEEEEVVVFTGVSGDLTVQAENTDQRNLGGEAMRDASSADAGVITISFKALAASSTQSEEGGHILPRLIPSGEFAPSVCFSFTSRKSASDGNKVSPFSLPNTVTVKVKERRADKRALLAKASHPYRPTNWKRGGSYGRMLCLAWSTAIAEVVIGAKRIFPDSMPDVVAVRPGFIFETPEEEYVLGRWQKMVARAECAKVDGRYDILLNPLDMELKTYWDIGKLEGERGLHGLVVVAIHEVAHILVQRHDEEFAYVMTRLLQGLDVSALAKSINLRLKAERRAGRKARVEKLAA